MLMQIAPKSILDVGIGFGKFGFLAREYTDIWRDRYFDWQTQIDGIEIYGKYIGDWQRAIYNTIYIGDAADIVPKLEKYDLIICTEVIEHMTKDNGLKLLKAIKDKCRFAFISTPRSVLVQDEANGNPHERHVTQWEIKDLEQFGLLGLIEDNSMALVIRNP